METYKIVSGNQIDVQRKLNDLRAQYWVSIEGYYVIADMDIVEHHVLLTIADKC
ncbi:MAG: hypothetical protein ACYS32_00570 [Planctomycetota bacterium]|jgi:hypothetical protein